MAKYTVEKLAGVYHLDNVKETASGFKLNADGSFLFFFTYGVIDRYGSGTWSISEDHVVFQSQPWQGKDFTCINAAVVDHNFITLKISGGNPVLLGHVFFSLQNGATGSWIKTNERGESAFPPQPFSTISIVFEFCQERYTQFVVDNPAQNYFEFRFEPWLMEVFFNAFRLKISGHVLYGKHPLIKGDKLIYEKA